MQILPMASTARLPYLSQSWHAAALSGGLPHPSRPLHPPTLPRPPFWPRADGTWCPAEWLLPASCLAALSERCLGAGRGNVATCSQGVLMRCYEAVVLPEAFLLAVWLHCQVWLEAQTGCDLTAGLHCCLAQQTSLWPCAVLHYSDRPWALLLLLPSACLHVQ